MYIYIYIDIYVIVITFFLYHVFEIIQSDENLTNNGINDAQNRACHPDTDQCKTKEFSLNSFSLISVSFVSKMALKMTYWLTVNI